MSEAATDPDMIGVLVVDDHAVVRSGPAAHLESAAGIEVVAQGMSNRQIAAKLSISERTARTHVSHVLTKLRLSSRTQAALVAVREVPLPPAGGRAGQPGGAIPR